MAIDNAYIASLTTYTDDELLKLYRWALANGAGGQSRSFNGRSITFPTTEDLKATIEWLETRIEAATNATGGNIALVRFGQEQ